MSVRLNKTSDLERLLVRAKRAAIELDVEQMHLCASLLNDSMQSLSSLSPAERQVFRMTLLRYRDVCAFIKETLEEILSQGGQGSRQHSGYGQGGRLKTGQSSPSMMTGGYS
jgi:hypothetical protein